MPARSASLLTISAISSFNSLSFGSQPNSSLALIDLQLAPKFQSAGPAGFRRSLACSSSLATVPLSRNPCLCASSAMASATSCHYNIRVTFQILPSTLKYSAKSSERSHLHNAHHSQQNNTLHSPTSLSPSCLPIPQPHSPQSPHTILPNHQHGHSAKTSLLSLLHARELGSPVHAQESDEQVRRSDGSAWILSLARRRKWLVGR